MDFILGIPVQNLFFSFFMVLLVKIKVKKLKWPLKESNPNSIGERSAPLPLHYTIHM